MSVATRVLPSNPWDLERLDHQPFRVHIACIDDAGEKRDLSCTIERDDKLEEVMRQVASVGSIYLTIDAYLLLILKKGWSAETMSAVIAAYKRDQELIAKGKHNGYVLAPPFDEMAIVKGVFPWPAEQEADVLPPITPQTDRICRNVARYYLMLIQRRVRDWNGMLRCFSYKIANTISYRAYASYHNIPREQRCRISPDDPEHKVLQFDWTAAEWSLILQHCGYALPADDPYGVFTASGIERDTAKGVVLAYVYGAAYETLVESRDQRQVDGVIAQIRADYPEVLAWRERIRNTTVVDFHGFQIDLGDQPHKRPNHWAQTALQLCKWELISRLVDTGAHPLAAGDLHDQLFFHFHPQEDAALAAAAIAEIRKPCFGRYDLRPKFQVGDHWQ